MHKDLTVVLQTVLGVPFFVYSAIQEIQFVQGNFIKYALNLAKQCSNYISRSEVNKLPLKLKIWSQMVKYLYNLNGNQQQNFRCFNICCSNEYLQDADII